MLHLSRVALVIAVAASIGLASQAEAAPTDAEKCEAAKLKESGKYVFCRLKADSKAVKKGLPPDYSKCDEKFPIKWDKAETKFGAECPTLGDESTQQAAGIDCADTLAAAVAPGSCGDGAVNQPSEECDGADDSACPGVCQIDCLCPVLPACLDGTGGVCSGGPFPAECTACCIDPGATCLDICFDATNTNQCQDQALNQQCWAELVASGCDSICCP